MGFLEKFECKHCKYKTYSAFFFIFHLIFKHKIKPTKKDIKFLIKYNNLKFIIYIPYILLKIICYPFWYFYENL